jgi:hypothetical protein
MSNGPLRPQMRPFEISNPDFATHIRESLYLRPIELVNARRRFTDYEHLAGPLKRFWKAEGEHWHVGNVATVVEHVFHLSAR